MVQYDKARVDAWLEKARKLDACELASTWHQLAFFPDGPVDLLPDIHHEWTTFSLWEQQHALYELAPVIQEIAAKQADALHREAREKEPL